MTLTTTAASTSEALAASSTKGVNGVALAVFVFFFLAVTVMGFLAARWRKAEQSANLDEWGLGGRSFGTWVTWFLLGGDLYTAYTFVAVPAAIYAAGASGFFAVPYTILVYPLIFTFLPASGRSRTSTATSPPRTSSAAASAPRDCRWPWRSPASSPRCRTSPSNWSASRPSWT